MFFEKNNGQKTSQKVLVAPLDWGLGHATRCIPIIYHLINQGATVFIAADGPIKILLQKELPQVVFLPLPGYNIRYSRRPGWLPVALLLQFPKLLWRVYKEHSWLKKACNTYRFNAVISDNRLGLYHPDIYTVYITHQLAIKTGHPFTERLAQKIHYHFINKYRVCWVPDNATGNSLAGQLSHPLKKPAIPVRYIGPLSRFEKKPAEKKYDLLVLLSGPEPQRTLLENTLLPQLQRVQQKILLVRGLPQKAAALNHASENIEVHNHLPAAALNTAILQAGKIICRSGYTTIMDLITLEKTALLLPTPGQTEQEYLASYLSDKNMFYTMQQDKFMLEAALEKNEIVPAVYNETGAYKNAVDDLLRLLQEKSSS